MNNNTIFALSSGHGKSGVAVVRISGDNLSGFAKKITKQKSKIIPRHAYFTNLVDDAGELIDQCIVIYFNAPHSFTGTDIIEIHTHGAPAVINRVFEFLSDNRFHMAMPGEFSRRAFYNNKMDLTDVDGLAALLDAQTNRQRQFALKSMLGGDGKTYANWRTQMIDIAAFAAAILDYADDELPTNITKTLRNRTQKLYNEIKQSLSRYAAVRAIQAGFNIVLAGPTNAGKSSIFNRIVGTNRAIVSDTPGTTRDVVSATIDIDGYMVNISDTAGLRDTPDDNVEQMGIMRTHDEINNADLVIRVCAPDTDTHMAPSGKNEIVVINKSDIGATGDGICISARTGDGFDKLMHAIKNKMHEFMDCADGTLVINQRTHDLLHDTQTQLDAALKTPDDNMDIFSEHVRHAADNIGMILGTISTSDVMDATFGQLCLGK